MDAVPVKTVTDVVTDFLSSAPSLEELANYRLPDEFQERAHYLLEKNQAGNLTEAEENEINTFRHIDHLITLFKTKARLRLKTET